MYEEIAPYYDLVHADLTADVDFVLELAKQGSGPILELGCGTGRLLVPLARAGHQVTGLDSSPEMLNLARSKLSAEPGSVQARARLVSADMRDFEVGGDFSLGIMPYNTLMHLEPREVTRALDRLRHHLLNGAKVFIDLDNPAEIADPAADGSLILERSMIDPGSGQTVLQFESSWVDTAAQTRHITWIFDASPADGGAVRRTVVQTAFHFFYPHDVELLLKSSGFRLQALYGDYDRTPFDEESHRMLVVAVAK